MDRNEAYTNFYQPQARVTSIRRLEALRIKSEQAGQMNYKEMLISKVKSQYQRLAAQQMSLQRHHRLLPETTDFDPLLKNEATRKYLETKNTEKVKKIKGYLKEIEDEEEVKYIFIKSPDLVAQFKTFNRDKALEHALNNKHKGSKTLFKSSMPVPQTQSKISVADLFMCNNDMLTRKLFPLFRQAFADRSSEIIEHIVDEMLIDEVNLIDS